jgi:hypothetical protein
MWGTGSWGCPQPYDRRRSLRVPSDWLCEPVPVTLCDEHNHAREQIAADLDGHSLIGVVCPGRSVTDGMCC